MKISMIVSILFLASTTFATDVYETKCKQGDCFRNGWMTTSTDYSLDTVCKNNDCEKFGWHSVANDNTTYDVTCKDAGCFVEGWKSTQDMIWYNLDDDVTCNSKACLTRGWKVQTGYDLMGGSVTCHQNDCSKYGGYSFWRGRNSHTSCNQGDCYHQGWILYID